MTPDDARSRRIGEAWSLATTIVTPDWQAQLSLEISRKGRRLGFERLFGWKGAVQPQELLPPGRGTLRMSQVVASEIILLENVWLISN
jgi:hypothetical protein